MESDLSPELIGQAPYGKAKRCLLCALSVGLKCTGLVSVLRANEAGRGVTQRFNAEEAASVEALQFDNVVRIAFKLSLVS